MTFISKGKGHPMTLLCRHREEVELKLVAISYMALEKRIWSVPRSGRFVLVYGPVLYKNKGVRGTQGHSGRLGKSRPHWDSIGGSSSPVRVALPSTMSQPPFISDQKSFPERLHPM
jgi:hypothetical protein